MTAKRRGQSFSFAELVTTDDVDIIGFRGDAAERLALMDLAESLGLPVETVNSAAGFFVHRIDDWREQVVLFRSGSNGRVYRPTATLFLLLKIRRLDERDLEDCRSIIASGELYDGARVIAAFDALAPSENAALLTRRADLRRLASQ